MLKLINALFQCRHNRCTFPITRKAGQQCSETAAVTGTYYVCLDCGKEFAYDWHSMEVVTPEPAATRLLKFMKPRLWRRAS
jgi:DNA-directed RNA polymerase subunit RPC12/RpoP